MSNESILYLGLLCALAALGLLAIVYAYERADKRAETQRAIQKQELLRKQRDHLAAMLEESIRENQEMEKQLRWREYEWKMLAERLHTPWSPATWAKLPIIYRNEAKRK